MNIKDYLEKGTNLIWKELRYLKPPVCPWFIFIDDTSIRGADILNNIREHNLVLEYYNEKSDDNYEKIIETFLNKEGFYYTKEREWLDEEKLYVTIYELNSFLEKVRKEEDKK